MSTPAIPSRHARWWQGVDWWVAGGAPLNLDLPLGPQIRPASSMAAGSAGPRHRPATLTDGLLTVPADSRPY